MKKNINSPDEKKYILTCVAAAGISTNFISECHKLLSLHALNLLHSQDLSLGDEQAISLHLQAPSTFEPQSIKNPLMELSSKFQTDAVLICDDQFRLKRKLIVFDMDSTLINAEVIDELAVVAGIGDKVKAITARAMNGEINFDQSLTERVKLLKGLKRQELKLVHSRLPLNPGVARFMRTIKEQGYKTAIISGGFNFFAEDLRRQLSMDYAFANELEFQDDTLTGRVIGEIINAERKANLLENLAQENNLSLEEVVAVGDGANDLPMLAKAGLGIAYHGKEKVRKEANYHLSHGPMTAILYYLGFTGKYLDDTP